MNDFIPRVDHRGPSSGGPRPPGSPGLIAKVLGTLAGIVLLVGAVLFSAVLLVVIPLVGAVVLGWIWWRTRALRRALREQMAGGDGPGRAGVRPGHEQTGSSRPGDRASAPLARRRADVADAEIIREVAKPQRPDQP